uniref:CLN6 transmembrane ER protein b n=1 Tax=Neogobius melanostomus TaxID=47308 RepID=A0A8C6S5W3_9GOBI
KEGERERDCVGGGAERRLAAASESDQAQTRTRFDLDLWALFLLQAWLLHLGRPVVMVDAIELLSYYDDTVGHVMWSVPFFLVLLFFFGSSFCYKRQQQTMPTAAWILMLPNALYLWLLVTEGQTVILFLFTCFAMVATVMRQRRRGMVADGNGLFMILSFSVALVLVVLWSACWWRDEVLRRKHRGLLFVPQPRTVFSLHIKKYMSW